MDKNKTTEQKLRDADDILYSVWDGLKDISDVDDVDDSEIAWFKRLVSAIELHLDMRVKTTPEARENFTRRMTIIADFLENLPDDHYPKTYNEFQSDLFLNAALGNAIDSDAFKGGPLYGEWATFSSSEIPEFLFGNDDDPETVDGYLGRGAFDLFYEPPIVETKSELVTLVRELALKVGKEQ